MPTMELDAIDARILTELQSDGGLTNAELAERVGLSPSPCLRRVKLLTDAGVIKKRVALVDGNAIDLKVSVFIHVTLEKQIEENLSEFEAAIEARPEVVECYLMTGESDYLLRVVVPDLEAYERFLMEHLTRIPGVSNIKSSFALNQVKYSTALPLDHLS
ncbi:MAG: Lrp/AsnC family transcriptional regulator [Rhodospirillales bacterium]|nr:Lrp/AsnC family transcriptional regulator [Rhodospirillales bacterium]